MKKVLSFVAMLVFVAGVAVAQTNSSAPVKNEAKKEAVAPKKEAAKADTTKKAHLKHNKKKAAAAKTETAK